METKKKFDVKVMLLVNVVIFFIKNQEKKGVNAMQITLRAARINADFTLNDVAKKVNITSKTISNWERGLTPISKELFDKLCTIYEAPSDMVIVPSVNDGVFEE